MELVFQAVLIGILQGLSEFIPISSSAHLELAPWIAGWQQDSLIGSLAFDVFLHLGTLTALIALLLARLDPSGTGLLRKRARQRGSGPIRTAAWPGC